MAGRPSLPGVDELFGPSSGRQARGPGAPEEGSADRLDAGAVAAARRALAEEDESLRAARRRAEAAAPPSPEVGALLRWLIRTGDARAVIEVGSAGGVSGAWVLAALPEGGVLTSIEPDPHLHGLANETYRSLTVTSRPRSIHGEPETVLPRLADRSYDLLLLQADPAGYPDDLVHARRLLRERGVLVARGVLRGGEHADALDRFVEAIADDPGFVATMLPVDGGLVLATRHHVEATS